MPGELWASRRRWHATAVSRPICSNSLTTKSWPSPAPASKNGPRPAARVTVWPAPENVVYCDQELLRQSVALAREYNVRWHSHYSEVKTDPEYYLKYYGMRPVDWMYEEGLLGDDATFAHGIYVNDQEIERLGETQSSVAYCPISHQYISCGVMRLRDLRAGWSHHWNRI